MRNKIVAGNWKMNLGIQQGADLIKNIIEAKPQLNPHQKVIFCTPFTHLNSSSEVLKSAPSGYLLGAQNCHDQPSGAYTGEISVDMLTELQVSAVIIGHSERRQYFGESNEFLKNKVDSLVSKGKMILFCCGEPLSIRESDKQNEYVARQLQESLFHLSAEAMMNHIVIAYEPIWAIGTGVTASTQQAQDMHAFIRSLLKETYHEDVSKEISILYGGSCNATNAAELFACPDVDGGLIGGAALKAESFLPIISAMP
ncbi:MAG: triose-phosphate isomerase [Chitinophagaceae bacterium]|nr:triose-phosphate isomerase [Chitinophagaceae bacterium]